MSDFLLPPLVATALSLIVTLGILITVHEFGHFWVARRLGVKVLRFSVGFGRPLWLRQGRDGTEFTVATIPLGGYVRMLDEREGPVAAAERDRAFNCQPVGTRIAIVAAGPLFNFMFAILAYTVLFMAGISGVRPLLDAPAPESAAAAAGFRNGDVITAVGGRATPTLQAASLALLEQALTDDRIDVQVEDDTGATRLRTLDLAGRPPVQEDHDLFAQLGLVPWPVPAVIGQVIGGSAAERAGVEVGDRILASDGQPLRNWADLVSRVRTRPGQVLNLEIERAGRRLTLAVTPDAVTEGGATIGKIGVSPNGSKELAERRVVVHYNPLEAAGAAVVKTWDMSVFTLRMLGRMLIGKASIENISGPLTIAQYAGQSASLGWAAFLSFLALVSISLGVLNLLPVPVLDGGHLLFYAIELVKGSPLPEIAQEFGQRLGIVLLVLLMGLALYNDLTRLLS